MVGIYDDSISRELFLEEIKDCITDVEQLKSNSKYHIYLEDQVKSIHSQLCAKVKKNSYSFIDFSFSTICDSVTFDGSLFKAHYGKLWYAKLAV